MVHSDSASPMNTTPSVSPHLSAPAEPPPPPPPADYAAEDLPRTPVKLSAADSAADPPLSQTPSGAEASERLSTVNGRTSGRKRTPKACDCCGHHGAGHNARPPGKGRGRGRGRGRGAGQDTARRKVQDQLRPLGTFDLTAEVDEEAEAEAEAAAQDGGGSQTPPTLDEPIRNCAAPEDGRNSGDVAKALPGATDNKVPVGQEGGVMKEGRGPETLNEEQKHSGKSPLGNGDTISLSEGEGDDADAVMDVTQPGGGPPSARRPDSPQDLDSDMQVDEVADPAAIAAALCNGSAAASPMEAEACQRPPPPAPPSYGAVAVCTALRDHRLYCRTDTWEEGSAAGAGQEEQAVEGQHQESLEQLVDMVHEFLEGFYIKYGSFSPLSETDVLEHLKEKRGGQDDVGNKGLNIGVEISRYRAALASAPVASFMLTHNKHTLSLDDLATLEEQNWLNDQIINMYGELIMEATQHKVHFFNSFFHKQLVAKGYEGVKRWTKKVDLFSKWLLLIPIHLEIHWSLVTVAMATKTINYYDSQGIVFRHTTDNIMKYLQSEAREKKQAAFQKGWKITIIKGIPQQKNDSDCGVFVLEYCRCLSVKQPLQFSQEDMPRIRKRIYKELCDCRLDV